MSVAAAVCISTVLAACGSSAAQDHGTHSGNQSTGGAGSGTLSIALEPDLGYAPLEIVQQEGWLKKALPGVSVQWQALNSGSAIEKGMISGHIDVGAEGLAPFLLGVDKGVGWKTLSTLDEQSLWMVCHDKIKSLHDIT